MSNAPFETLGDASEANMENSVARALADALLANGYLVYWYVGDGLETPEGWYESYRTNQSTYLATPTLSGRVAASKGLLTLVDRPSALPRSPTRPTTEGTVSPQGLVQVPVGVIEVSEVVNGQSYELGTRRRWRSRILALTLLCRTKEEQSGLAGLLEETFDEEFSMDVLDHVGGTLAPLGSIEFLKVSVDRALNAGGPDAENYEVVVQAQLQFVA
jgi:hypothetical protein